MAMIIAIDMKTFNDGRASIIVLSMIRELIESVYL